MWNNSNHTIKPLLILFFLFLLAIPIKADGGWYTRLSDFNIYLYQNQNWSFVLPYLYSDSGGYVYFNESYLNNTIDARAGAGAYVQTGWTNVTYENELNFLNVSGSNADTKWCLWNATNSTVQCNQDTPTGTSSDAGYPLLNYTTFYNASGELSINSTWWDWWVDYNIGLWTNITFANELNFVNATDNTYVRTSWTNLSFDDELNQTEWDAMYNAYLANLSVWNNMSDNTGAGNNSWNESYADSRYFYNLTNFTSTLTDSRLCTYVSATDTLDCDIDAVSEWDCTDWDGCVSNAFDDISNFTVTLEDQAFCYYDLGDNSFYCVDLLFGSYTNGKLCQAVTSGDNLALNCDVTPVALTNVINSSWTNITFDNELNFLNVSDRDTLLNNMQGNITANISQVRTNIDQNTTYLLGEITSNKSAGSTGAALSPINETELTNNTGVLSLNKSSLIEYTQDSALSVVLGGLGITASYEDGDNDLLMTFDCSEVAGANIYCTANEVINVNFTEVNNTHYNRTYIDNNYYNRTYIDNNVVGGSGGSALSPINLTELDNSTGVLTLNKSNLNQTEWDAMYNAYYANLSVWNNMSDNIGTGTTNCSISNSCSNIVYSNNQSFIVDNSTYANTAGNITSYISCEQIAGAGNDTNFCTDATGAGSSDAGYPLLNYTTFYNASGELSINSTWWDWWVDYNIGLWTNITFDNELNFLNVSDRDTLLNNMQGNITTNISQVRTNIDQNTTYLLGEITANKSGSGGISSSYLQNIMNLTYYANTTQLANNLSKYAIHADVTQNITYTFTVANANYSLLRTNQNNNFTSLALLITNNKTEIRNNINDNATWINTNIGKNTTYANNQFMNVSGGNFSGNVGMATGTKFCFTPTCTTFANESGFYWNSGLDYISINSSHILIHKN